MKLTSDFECGNGKKIREVTPGHFYVEEEGEKAPYCKYFCVRADGETAGGPLRLTIFPDPELGEEGRKGMMSHYPSQLWFSEEPMGNWVPVNNRWPGADRFAEDRIETQVVVPPGKSLYVASNVVWPYSQIIAWAKEISSKSLECDSLGESYEKRSIPRLHIPSTGARPRKVFGFAGQHPSEHCGPLAIAGIAEFLLSPHPEAEAIRKRCDVWLIPLINVDGNVHGRNGWTMQNVNPFMDFTGAAGGKRPQAVEDQLLWDWLSCDLKPHICFNFHGYLGRRRMAEPPYEGCYILPEPEKIYGKGKRLKEYHRLCEAMFWDTPGLTAHNRPGTLDESSLENQLARACGTLPAFYEINHGYCSVQGARRRGADVFRAVMRSLLGKIGS